VKLKDFVQSVVLSNPVSGIVSDQIKTVQVLNIRTTYITCKRKWKTNNYLYILEIPENNRERKPFSYIHFSNIVQCDFVKKIKREMASKTIEIDIGSDDVSSQQRHEMALVTGIIGEEVSSEENKKVRSKKKKKQSHSKKKKKKSQKIKDNITKEQKRTTFVFFIIPSLCFYIAVLVTFYGLFFFPPDEINLGSFLNNFIISYHPKHNISPAIDIINRLTMNISEIDVNLIKKEKPNQTIQNQLNFTSKKNILFPNKKRRGTL